jgi:hypothetical protein
MFNNCLEAENEFDTCWLNPACGLEKVEVNKILFMPLVRLGHFTGKMLWDMEIHSFMCRS